MRNRSVATPPPHLVFQEQHRKPTLQESSLETSGILSHIQLFVTLWTGSPGSSIHGTSQTRILEWAAISYQSNTFKG